MAKTAKKLPSVTELSSWVADNSLLFGDPSPFRVGVSADDTHLAVVTGDNASGKSLFVRVVGAIAQQRHKMLPVSVSIRERTGAGMDGSGGMRRVMMFGDEQEQSTGATSVGVVATAFGNVDRDQGAILIVDEPEMGLSEGYARALGEFIGTQAKDTPASCRGVLVVTHSRPLVSGLLEGYGKPPAHIVVSAENEPGVCGLKDWLAADEHRSVEELLALRDVGLDRWRRVGKILRD